jgi:hypothetical protein
MKIFQITEKGDILDWDKLDLESKDAVMYALREAEKTYMWDTRRIIDSESDDNPKQIQELMPYVGHKCISGDIEGIFKGVEETWEDYYYIIEKPDNKVTYNTMVDSIDFID